MISLGRLGALLSIGLLASSPPARLNIVERIPSPEPEPKPMRRPTPMDTGPVIDTTPESKRARRRRLAREGGQHG